MKLTIAIICKNEEKNIKRCLDSVFKCCRTQEQYEVLLVDSFSTDNTISIAEQYPVKIIRLKKDWFHSPAAGRYTAFIHAKGSYTLCLDADMELECGFLEKSMHFMSTNPKVAAVTGILENLYRKNRYKPLIVTGSDMKTNNLNEYPVTYKGQLESIPGAGLFKTDAVRAVGNFQPFLRAEEEYELCQRLKYAGYELWYLPVMIAKHYGYEQNEFNELSRRIRNGFMAGIGEMFKWSCQTGFFKFNFKRFSRQILVGGYVSFLPVCLVLFFLKPAFIVLWSLGLALIILAFSFKKKNIFDGIIAFLTQAVIGLNIIFKLFGSISTPETYPLDVIIIDLSKNKDL